MAQFVRLIKPRRIGRGPCSDVGRRTGSGHGNMLDFLNKIRKWSGFLRLKRLFLVRKMGT